MKKFNLWAGIVQSVIVIISAFLNCILYLNNICPLRDNFIITVLGTTLCSWLPYLIEIILKIKITKFSCVFYELFIFCSSVLGTIWNFYNIIPIWDNILHTSSGVLIALFAYDLFNNSKKNNNLNSVWLFVLVFAIALAGGTLWEIWEFTTDLILNGNTQHCLNKIGREAIMDTMIDTVCNTVGAIIGSIIVILLQRKKQIIKKAD